MREHRKFNYVVLILLVVVIGAGLLKYLGVL
jgi:hypothetical protein